MLLPKERGFIHPAASEITPASVFFDRRRVIAGLGALAAVGLDPASAAAPKAAALPSTRSAVPGAITMDKTTPLETATGYNNFYEFGTDKSDPAQHAHTLKTKPWTVAIDGEVLPRACWETFALPRDARVEVLTAMQGG